jgi:heterodisulfide reductase subunit D
MVRTGRTKEAKENAQTVSQAIAKTGAERVIVSCAGCLKALRTDYPEKFGIELPPVLHITEYADQLIRDGRLRPRRQLKGMRIAYHDPCHMGRELGIYDAPRDVLRSIPGVELVEMDPSREAAMCCGAGGGLRLFAPDLAKRIAADRVRAAEVTGARIVASSCPFCEHNLCAGKELSGSAIDVVDVTVLLANSLL